MLGIFGNGKRTKEQPSTTGVFEADLFAIVSKKVPKAEAEALRGKPESMLLVAAAAGILVPIWAILLARGVGRSAPEATGA